MFDYIPRTIFIVVVAVLILALGGVWVHGIIERSNLEEQLAALPNPADQLSAIETRLAAVEAGSGNFEVLNTRINALTTTVESGDAALQAKLDTFDAALSDQAVRIAKLETAGATSTTSQNVRLSATMSPYQIIEAPGDYTFIATFTNLTNEYLRVALKATFTAKTTGANVDAAMTKMTVDGDPAIQFYENYIPSAINCLAMEFENSLPAMHFILPSRGTITKTVVLHLEYTTGIAEWSYSFGWDYNW